MTEANKTTPENQPENPSQPNAPKEKPAAAPTQDAGKTSEQQQK